jgi:hypothetical protein
MGIIGRLNIDSTPYLPLGGLHQIETVQTKGEPSKFIGHFRRPADPAIEPDRHLQLAWKTDLEEPQAASQQ